MFTSSKIHPFFPTDKTSNCPAVRFVCGSAVPFKVELPSEVPDSLQLIGATLDTGTHYAVLCCQSFITKGTRYGPYRGTVVQPFDVINREDTAFMWEVMRECRVSARQFILISAETTECLFS